MALKMLRNNPKQALFIMIWLRVYCGYNDKNAISFPLGSLGFILIDV